MTSRAQLENLELGAASAVLLVVEDDVIVRTDLAEYLRESGFTVIEAADANEALAVLRSAADLAAMITDVRMPGDIDGLELVDLARTVQPDLLIVVTSGDAPEAAATKASDLFFRKPYAFGPLLAQVQELTVRRMHG
jgi:two-component system, response regulator PdtaR